MVVKRLIDKLFGKQSPALAMYDYFEEDKAFYQAASDLDMLATQFINRRYLQNLSKLPRMQDVPPDAFSMRPVNPIFISHAWLGLNQPDDTLLDRIREFIPNDPSVGLWIDYCCLPQSDRSGKDKLSEPEWSFFKSQLQYIPTVLAKTQVIVLWNESHLNRAWCVVELLVADICKNVVMKQIYHNRTKLSGLLNFATQTYAPDSWSVTTIGDDVGQLVAKILLPHRLKDVPNDFYMSMLNQLGMPPTPVTTLLSHVRSEHIDRFFRENHLTTSNPHDISVLKQILLNICKFAGTYDVTTIKWSGTISCNALLPYVWSNLSDFTVRLVDYDFAE